MLLGRAWLAAGTEFVGVRNYGTFELTPLLFADSDFPAPPFVHGRGNLDLQKIILRQEG
jgi:hypothetical protein